MSQISKSKEYFNYITPQFAKKKAAEAFKVELYEFKNYAHASLNPKAKHLDLLDFLKIFSETGVKVCQQKLEGASSEVKQGLESQMAYWGTIAKAAQTHIKQNLKFENLAKLI